MALELGDGNIDENFLAQTFPSNPTINYTAKEGESLVGTYTVGVYAVEGKPTYTISYRFGGKS